MRDLESPATAPTTKEGLPAWFDTVTTLFVIGCPRSGTTWIQRMLLALDGVAGGQETHFFIAFASAFQSYDDARSSERDVGLSWYLDRDAFLRELRRLWVLTQGPLVESVEDPRVLLEKTPSHARYAREIDRLLPKARFLHVIRDGRAVAASLMAASRSWGKAWAPSRVGAAIRMWRSHVLAGRGARSVVGEDRYLETRYEDMRAEPVEGLRAIARFVGLDPTDEALEEAVRLHDAENVRSGRGDAVWAAEPEGFLRRAETGSWREELGLWERLKIRRYAGGLLAELGYLARSPGAHDS